MAKLRGRRRDSPHTSHLIHAKILHNQPPKNGVLATDKSVLALIHPPESTRLLDQCVVIHIYYYNVIKYHKDKGVP